MEILVRRRLITTKPNPDESIDYMVWLDENLIISEKIRLEFNIGYVPDRQVLEDDAISAYLQAVREELVVSIEHFGILVFSDFNNELVPRWIQITLTRSATTNGYIKTHKLQFRDKQPNWNNQQLLSNYLQS